MNDLIEKISAGLLDDLTTGERAELEALLANDPAARAESQELTAMNTLLSKHHDTRQADPTLEQRMVAGFRRRDHASGFPGKLRRWFRLPVVFIPAAAAIFISLVGIGSSLTGERSPSHGGIAVSTDKSLEEFRRNETLNKTIAPGSRSEKWAVGGGAKNAFSGESFKAAYSELDELKAAEFPPPQLPRDAPRPATAATEFAATGVRTSLFDEEKDKEIAFQVIDEAASELPASKSEADVSPVDSRKLIRNANAEIEVRGFAAASTALSDLAQSVDGYVATQNSSRLPNDKMSGAIVLKVPPPSLDSFLKQLRTIGEIRNQSIGTQDVTKAYFDTEARMKNARVMEQRLIELLRDTKGKVSDLLQVEKELGRVREQIEQMQGELKLWDSLVAYATVNVQLFEKDMDEAAAYVLNENATLALATTDVEKTFGAARKIAEEEKAQITQSNVSRDGNGNASAVLSLVIDPDSSDATLARLKSLGSVLEFREESNRIARDGNGEAPTAKTDRAPVRITVSIRSQDQNPTQRTQLRLETNTVPDAANQLRTYAAENAIEIKESTFSQQPDGRTVATLRLSLPLSKNEALMERIRRIGKVENLSVQRNDSPEAAAVEPRAEIALTITQPPRLVANENGLFATLRRTFSQAVGALMWSVRMIGVALAFLAPWIGGLAVIVIAWKAIRRGKRKA